MTPPTQEYIAELVKRAGAILGAQRKYGGEATEIEDCLSDAADALRALCEPTEAMERECHAAAEMGETPPSQGERP
jgi:hypothetical protein